MAGCDGGGIARFVLPLRATVRGSAFDPILPSIREFRTFLAVKGSTGPLADFGGIVEFRPRRSLSKAVRFEDVRTGGRRGKRGSPRFSGGANAFHLRVASLSPWCHPWERGRAIGEVFSVPGADNRNIPGIFRVVFVHECQVRGKVAGACALHTGKGRDGAGPAVRGAETPEAGDGRSTNKVAFRGVSCRC